MFKYNLDQLIYYMKDNRVHSAPVLARMRTDNLHPTWNSTSQQKEIFTPWGPTGTFYGTCHGKINENEAFATKEDLAAALIAS